MTPVNGHPGTMGRISSIPQGTFIASQEVGRSIMVSGQGCGIKGFLPTSVIQGSPLLYEQDRLWEALSVVSQKWSFPTAPFLVGFYLLFVSLCGMPSWILSTYRDGSTLTSF